VARHDGRVVFVRHALPGERVRAVVTDGGASSRFLRADAVEVLVASPDRVAPRCPHAGPGGCGGCDFQHVSVAAQRRLKAAVVAEQLQRLAGIDRAVAVEPVTGDDDGLGWRTRERFAIDPAGRAGLRRHRSHEVLPLGSCPLCHPLVAETGVLDRTWPGVAELEVAVSVSTGEQLVLADGAPTGRGRLTERAAGRDWRVTGGGFWQVHPGAADALVGAVRSLAAPAAGERVRTSPSKRSPRILPEALHSPKRISPTERFVTRTEPCRAEKTPGETGAPSTRSARRITPPDSALHTPPEEMPERPPATRRNDVGTSDAVSDTFVGHPSERCTSPSIRTWGDAERKKNVPSATPRRPSARTPENCVGPTEIFSAPAVNRATSHPTGPRRTANPASTAPLTSPGFSRRRREKTWAISIPVPFPSIPIPFPPPPFVATWNEPSPMFPSARASQPSAEPALPNFPSTRNARRGTPRTSTRAAWNVPVASTFPALARILPSASPFPSIPAR